MEYGILPDPKRIQITLNAVRARGVSAELVDTKEAALERLRALIPPGAEVMTGASTTLAQIGFDALLASGLHPWHNRKADITAENDPARRSALRKQSTLADYFLGSVHAIAETGELIVASATGSQLASYAFSSSHVIWVAGAQKIVPNLEDAVRRVREYVLPLEDRHMKSVNGPQSGSFIGKLMIFEKEAPYLHRSVTLLLVKEVLGF